MKDTISGIMELLKRAYKMPTVNEILGGKEITPTSQSYLDGRKEFDLDKQNY